MGRQAYFCVFCLWMGGFLSLLTTPVYPQEFPGTGAGLYEIGCAKCHGDNGRGAPAESVGFSTPLPDLTDCSFATREPDFDWIAVTHQGGPVRGFDGTMPAFGEAFSVEQIQKIIDFIRGFCSEPAWPRGELNFPRALSTEKAYPEDEIVWTTTFQRDSPASVTNQLLYERRFGARNQLELTIPFGASERGSDGWRGVVGDVSLGVKRVLYDRLDRGFIVSAIGEVTFPTGDERSGFGRGTPAVEPALLLGQALPGDSFVQAQAGALFPVDTSEAERQWFWRAAFGRTFVHDTWGRSVTPMLEILGRAQRTSDIVTWDLQPQAQVSLNRRQHILANVGVRLPLNHRESRSSQILFYVLWEWFDGGLLDGW